MDTEHSGPSWRLSARAAPSVPELPITDWTAVIVEGLDPLVEFDIDTGKLAEQADAINGRLQPIAEQYRQLREERARSEQEPARMFQ